MASIYSSLVDAKPPRGLPPYRGEDVWAPQWPGELCWWERKLLVGSLMPHRSKGKAHKKSSPWSSGFGIGHVITPPPQRNLPLQNLQSLWWRTMERARTLTGLYRQQRRRRIYRALMMIYNTRDYWVFGLSPSSGILKKTTFRKL
jgi:hypothetical protein